MTESHCDNDYKNEMEKSHELLRMVDLYVDNCLCAIVLNKSNQERFFLFQQLCAMACLRALIH